jgi:hypothetical protein
MPSGSWILIRSVAGLDTGAGAIIVVDCIAVADLACWQARCLLATALAALAVAG